MLFIVYVTLELICSVDILLFRRSEGEYKCCKNVRKRKRKEKQRRTKDQQQSMYDRDLKEKVTIIMRF